MNEQLTKDNHKRPNDQAERPAGRQQEDRPDCAAQPTAARLPENESTKPVRSSVWLGRSTGQ